MGTKNRAVTAVIVGPRSEVQWKAYLKTQKSPQRGLFYLASESSISRYLPNKRVA